jgi:hypothetical protein
MMLYTNDLLVTPNLGTPTLGRAGTAAGTSSAAAAGASFTATVRTGQAVGVGQALEIDETMVALPDRVDTSPRGSRAPAVLSAAEDQARGHPWGSGGDCRTSFLPKYGPREARRMYWSHFIRSIAGTVPPWLLRH